MKRILLLFKLGFNYFRHDDKYLRKELRVLYSINKQKKKDLVNFKDFDSMPKGGFYNAHHSYQTFINKSFIVSLFNYISLSCYLLYILNITIYNLTINIFINIYIFYLLFQFINIILKFFSIISMSFKFNEEFRMNKFLIHKYDKFFFYVGILSYCTFDLLNVILNLFLKIILLEAIFFINKEVDLGIKNYIMNKLHPDLSISSFSLFIFIISILCFTYC